MRRPAATWAACLGGLIALDVWCDRRKNESTLSCVVRHTFRVEHPAGKAAFLAAWAGLTAWLVPHILRVVRDA